MSQVHRRERGTGEPQPMPAPAVAERAASAAKSVNAAVNSAANRLGLADQVAKNPYGVAAAALAIGYFVGGGLFTRTTARLIQFGAHLSTLPVIRNRFLEVAERAVDVVIDQSKRINDER